VVDERLQSENEDHICVLRGVCLDLRVDQYSILDSAPFFHSPQRRTVSEGDAKPEVSRMTDRKGA